MTTLAHKGDEAYRNDFELVMRRESRNANDLWQADGRRGWWTNPIGRRPWLTVILDDKCRAVAGYTLFLGDPNAW